MRNWKVVAAAVVIAVLAFWVSLAADQETAPNAPEQAVAKQLPRIADQPQLVFSKGAKGMVVPNNCNLVVDVTPPGQKDYVVHAVYEFQSGGSSVTYVRIGTGKGKPTLEIKEHSLDESDTPAAK